jgi:hypothetical protein
MGFFSSHIKTFNDLFVHSLRDIYYAESQIVKALPKMIDKVTDSKLKSGFETHLSPIGASFRTAWRRVSGDRWHHLGRRRPCGRNSRQKRT